MLVRLDDSGEMSSLNVRTLLFRYLIFVVAAMIVRECEGYDAQKIPRLVPGGNVSKCAD